MLHITDFSSACVTFDTYADYVPVLSSVTNLTDLFLKYVVYPSTSESTRESSHYFAYLQTKSRLRSIVSTIPVLGNVIAIIVDIANSIFAKACVNDAKKYDSMGDTFSVGNPSYYAIATKHYTSALRKGSKEAAYQIGLRFRTGKGLKHANPDLSIKYLRIAAVRGHIEAQNELKTLNTSEIRNLITEKISEKYKQREIEYPAEFAMNMVYGPQGTNIYAFEALADWANKKYDAGLTAEHIQQTKPKNLHKQLLELSESFNNGRLQQLIDDNIHQSNTSQIANWANKRFNTQTVTKMNI